MALLDLLGALLTLLALGLLLAGGYLGALRLLPEAARRDPLAFAVAALLLATAEATAIGLALGAFGQLRLGAALGIALLIALLLFRSLARRPGAGPLTAPLSLVARRSWARLARHPALSLLLVHAAGSELARGLLRPPLSWDSLMYHLPLAASFLQTRGLAPVFGPNPVNYFGYNPANGSLWLWWFLAPSHSELWVNLAFLPQWVLLGLAAGAFARQLGAARRWDLAIFLVLPAPVVVRFLATQYVDIYLAAALLAAAFFALRWMEEPRWPEALLVGSGLGLVCGAKLPGVPYALALGGAAMLLARGRWRVRLPQVAASLLLFALLGSFFYLRNVAVGAGPFGLVCGGAGLAAERSSPRLPRPDSVLAMAGPLLAEGTLTDTFLGVLRPQSLDLGLGPPALVLAVATLLFPFFLAPDRRRGGWLAALQIAAQLFVWVTIPYAAKGHIFANVRYLDGAIALGVAGALAAIERRGLSRRWSEGLVLAFLAQDLLLLHAEMPREVRIAIAWIDLAAVVLALSPTVRRFLARHRWPVAAVVFAGCLAAVPPLARFRAADRGRAFAQELTAHLTSTRLLAGGWQWLDQNGGDGAVDLVMEPGNYFSYPDMGMRLERRVAYVNVNRRNSRNAVDYPLCDPRVDPSPDAWLDNLRQEGVRWLHLSRYPVFDFPVERQWADARPDLFALRYQDNTNRVYEVLPAAVK